ncbi:hypothetical protein [Patulibacter sp. SYSU D01012]|uniref:hypothetical protein n=1 Tax=Patulibacter sp. SYSU D01012 TaxID=2817381 RepID=UPI001B305324|nr:hypothetical protein [Patulibacter sp. SYSU D01012]
MTSILRLSNVVSEEVVDVYCPVDLETLGRISGALGEGWTATVLPANAPRPSVLGAPEPTGTDDALGGQLGDGGA